MIATVFATAIILVLALAGRLATLAEATSLIMLCVFALVNLSLVRVKRSNPSPEDLILFPFWVPVLSFLLSTAFIILEIISLSG